MKEQKEKSKLPTMICIQRQSKMQEYCPHIPKKKGGIFGLAEFPLVIYHQNKPYVVSSLKQGKLDYVTLSSIGFMDRFFAFLFEIGFFDKVSPSFPSLSRKDKGISRMRAGIPFWFLIAAYLQLKLHVERAFLNLPYILNSGVILNKLGFNVGPIEGGFNKRNKEPRTSPIDQDAARKFFKNAPADKVMQWYNNEVVGFFNSYKVFDPEGVFILDSSYFPLPPNPNYERASWLPLDEEGNFIDTSKLSEEERKKIRNTLCYNLVALMHVGFPRDYFLFSGLHLGPGKESALTEGEKIVDNFIQKHGKGRIKILVADRLFIDGPMISKFKIKYSIDTVMPLKKNMDAYTDAWGISKLPSITWTTYNEEKDIHGELIEKIELALVSDVTIWENCDVPLHVVLVRETKPKEEKKLHEWAIATTMESPTATQVYELYYRRWQIEERFDQVKNFWNIYKFTSTSFNLVTNQTVFILLAYTLLQLYLENKQMQKWANRSLKTLKYREKVNACIIAYKDRHFALFRIEEYQDILLNLEGEARERMRKKTRELLRARPPPDFSDITCLPVFQILS